MLENKRYQAARKAMGDLSNQSGNVEVNKDMFDELLIHQYNTQRAVDRVSTNSSKHPKNILKIDTPLIPDKISWDNEKPTAIHLLGMPRAGKTTVANMLTELEKETNFDMQVVHESAGDLKEIWDKRGFDYHQYLETQITVNVVNLLLFNKGIVHKKPPKLVIVERGILDMLPFASAHFLHGRLNHRQYMGALSSVKNTSSFLQKYNNVFITSLIPPEESMTREGERENVGRIMNLPFLDSLYDQYLWLHDIFTYDNPLSRSSTYACINLSGGRDMKEKNISKFISILLELSFPKKKTKLYKKLSKLTSNY